MHSQVLNNDDIFFVVGGKQINNQALTCQLNLGGELRLFLGLHNDAF